MARMQRARGRTTNEGWAAEKHQQLRLGAMISLALPWATEILWKALSRKVTWSDIHFKKIILAALWRMSCKEARLNVETSWELTRGLGKDNESIDSGKKYSENKPIGLSNWQAIPKEDFSNWVDIDAMSQTQRIQTEHQVWEGSGFLINFKHFEFKKYIRHPDKDTKWEVGNSQIQHLF